MRHRDVSIACEWTHGQTCVAIFRSLLSLIKMLILVREPVSKPHGMNPVDFEDIYLLSCSVVHGQLNNPLTDALSAGHLALIAPLYLFDGQESASSKSNSWTRKI